MKNNIIVIETHLSHRDEYGELVEYLENKCWKHEILDTEKRSLTDVKIKLEFLVSKIEDILETLPSKGSTSTECQKMHLDLQLRRFSHSINGLSEEDLIEDEE